MIAYNQAEWQTQDLSSVQSRSPFYLGGSFRQTKWLPVIQRKVLLKALSFQEDAFAMSTRTSSKILKTLELVLKRFNPGTFKLDARKIINFLMGGVPAQKVEGVRVVKNVILITKIFQDSVNLDLVNQDTQERTVQNVDYHTKDLTEFVYRKFFANKIKKKFQDSTYLADKDKEVTVAGGYCKLCNKNYRQVQKQCVPCPTGYIGFYCMYSTKNYREVYGQFICKQNRFGQFCQSCNQNYYYDREQDNCLPCRNGTVGINCEYCDVFHQKVNRKCICRPNYRCKT